MADQWMGMLGPLEVEDVNEVEEIKDKRLGLLKLDYVQSAAREFRIPYFLHFL